MSFRARQNVGIIKYAAAGPTRLAVVALPASLSRGGLPASGVRGESIDWLEVRSSEETMLWYGICLTTLAE